MPAEIFFYIASFSGIYFSLFLIITLIENRNNFFNSTKNSKLPDITIIIPCYNEEKTIEKTTHSILNSNYPKKKIKIFIVDDGSQDATSKKSKELENLYKGVVFSFSKKNGGKYTALNHGIKRAETELIASIDADCMVDPEAIGRIAPYFSDPETMAVTSSVKVNEPTSVWQHFQNVLYIFVVLLRKTFSFFGSVKVTPGPLSVYRRKIFEQIGYYKFGHQTEDIEMGLRLQSNNYKIEHALNAYVYTTTPSTFKALRRQRVRWAYGGILNLWDYRSLVNIKHGNLGLMVIPSNFLSFVFLPASASIVTYRIISDFVESIQNWSAVGFKMDALFPSFSILSISLPHPLFIIATFQLFLTFTFIMCSKNLTQDKSKLGRSMILALLFGAPLFTFWLFSAFYKIITRKVAKW